MSMWVFKTCARVRGAQRTLNQLRTTSRKKKRHGVFQSVMGFERKIWILALKNMIFTQERQKKCPKFRSKL